MSDEVCEASRSALEETKVAPMFYVVSVKKFVVMLVATFGLYVTYWYYRNWKLYKVSTGAKIWPIARALLSIFFMYALFKRIDRVIQASGRSFGLYPALRTGLIVICMYIGMILEVLPIAEVSVSVILALLCLQVYLIVGVQQAINFSQYDPKGTANAVLTGANYAWILLVVLVILLAFVGLVLLFLAAHRSP